eukprot:14082896-Ditylum_brightwellii.AAC.1
MIHHFQHHTIHNGIVPWPFNKYLPIDDDGGYIYHGRTNQQQNIELLPYMRKWLSVFQAQLTCKREDMRCYGEEDVE